MKFLYLIMQPLVKRDFERFGIKYFLDKGHDITVLDVSDYIHPKIANDRTNVVQDFRLNLRVIGTKKELLAERETFAASDLVFVLIYSVELSPSAYTILRMIAETGTQYLIRAPSFYAGITFQKTKMSLRVSIKDIFVRLKKINVRNSVLNRLPQRWLGIPKADYIIYNGHASQRNYSLVGPKTIPIYAHTADFDLYLDHAKTEPENQAVFIDQYVPYHPGHVALKSTGVIDPDLYYGRLRALFDRIENELNLKVVIAAHPRANYHLHKGVFGDREIFYGKTSDQIAKSRLVMVHISTAVSFAILFRKPVMILTTKELYNLHPLQKNAWGYEISSKELGVPLTFFDNPDEVDLANLPTVNDQLYDRYIDKYIKTPESPSKPLWEIVHDALEQAPAKHDAGQQKLN